MSSVHHQLLLDTQKNKKILPIVKKKKSVFVFTNPQMAQMLDLADKTFKTAIIFRELKENIVIMSEYVGHLNREIETIKESNENSRMEKLNN